MVSNVGRSGGLLSVVNADVGLVESKFDESKGGAFNLSRKS